MTSSMSAIELGSEMHGLLLGYYAMETPDETSPFFRPINVSGVMTRENWRDWFRQYIESQQEFGDTERDDRSEQDQIKLDFLTDEIADTNFETISQSEFLVENFFMLSRSIQNVVQRMNRFSLDSIVLLASLCQKVHKQHPAIDFAEVDAAGLYDYLRNWALPPEGFEALIQEYEALSKRNSVRTGPVIILLLTILYGESLIVEVLQRWVDVSCDGTPEDFADVVQNWSNLREYPLDWSISVVR